MIVRGANFGLEHKCSQENNRIEFYEFNESSHCFAGFDRTSYFLTIPTANAGAVACSSDAAIEGRKEREFHCFRYLERGNWFDRFAGRPWFGHRRSALAGCWECGLLRFLFRGGRRPRWEPSPGAVRGARWRFSLHCPQATQRSIRRFRRGGPEERRPQEQVTRETGRRRRPLLSFCRRALDHGPRLH